MQSPLKVYIWSDKSDVVFFLLTPSAIAWAIPNLGTFFAHSGLKWSVRHILPPLYILAVLPSSSGIAISIAVAGYVTGIYGYQTKTTNGYGYTILTVIIVATLSSV